MEVTLYHSITKNGTSMVEERTHELSQFTGTVEDIWNSDEMAELLPALADWCGMYSHDITKLRLIDRCKLAEELIKSDEQSFFWQAGRVNVPPSRAQMIWDKYNEEGEFYEGEV